MSKPNELKTCPFCGATLGASVNIERFAGKLYIRCGKCGAMTRACYTETEVVKIWNNRV